MLPQIVEAKRTHCRAPADFQISKNYGRRPPKEATPARLHSSPPKRFFGLVNDIAPGKADVVQVAVGQFGQLAPILLALPPDMERIAELGQKPISMIIYHRFMCAIGHFYLLDLISCPLYLRHPRFRQTTLCIALHDINS
jgi:hypothetical protein